MTGAIRFLVFRVFSPLKMRTNFIIVARIRSFQRLTGVSISQKGRKKKEENSRKNENRIQPLTFREKFQTFRRITV